MRRTDRAGVPTVVLVSGYRDSADVWTESALLSLLPGAVGPPVFEALARSTRVCAYDRPGTVRYIDQGPLTDRTSPVEQPRTAGDLVVERRDRYSSRRPPRRNGSLIAR